MMKEKILRCQELGADKTLSFGCMLNRKTSDGCEKIYYVLDRSNRGYWISSVPFGTMDLEFDENMISSSSGDTYEIIGHPITYSRLCYLFRPKILGQEQYDHFNNIVLYLQQDARGEGGDLFNKTILERPDELVDLVLSFLESL